MSFLPEGVSLAESPVMAHIYNRIYSLLPHESKLPMLEVEEMPLFLNARRALITMASSNLQEDIMKYSVLVLEKINELDNYLIMKQRSPQSLCSILVVLRLLADTCKIHWDAREPVTRKNSIDSNQSMLSITSVIGLGLGSEAIDYHTVQPERMDSQVVKRAIALISRLKSTATLTHELAFINGKTISQASLYEDMSTKPYFEQIDVNCAAILRFLAAANPQDFYDFTVSKLSVLKHNINNDGEFAPYLELFAVTYLDEQSLHAYLKHLRVILATVKKAAYRHLVLSFFLKALKIWINSRPQQFLNCTRPDTKVCMEADIFFDELSQMPDMTGNSRTQASTRALKTSYKFLAMLLALNPTSLDPILGRESQNVSKLKKLTNFSGSNKKQKVVAQVTKVLEQQSVRDPSENTAVLEALDFMVILARIAGSIYSYEPNHAVVQFTLQQYELVSRVLVPINSSKPSPLIYNPSNVEIRFFDKLRMNYFSSICVLRSKESTPLLIDILNDENAPLDTLNITCSILKTFVMTPALKNANQQLLMSMYPSLRKVMIRVGSLVKNSSYNPSLFDEEDASSFGKTNSSASSVEHYNHKTGLVGDTGLRTNTPTSNSSFSTPKAEKFKDTAKSLLKHHHSSSHVTTQTTSSSFDETRSTSEKEAAIMVSQLSRDILMNAFDIFRKSPHMYFYSFMDDGPQEKTQRLLNNALELLEPFVTALSDSNLRLVQTAKYYIQSFVAVTNIQDNADSVIAAFTGGALIAYVLSKAIINASASETRRKDILEYFVKLLEYRVSLYQVLEHHSYFVDAKFYERPTYPIMSASVEEAILVCLSAPTIDTYGFVKRIVKALLKEYQGGVGGPDFQYNHDLYLAIANDTSLITGQVALQKNVRKFFLKVNVPSLPVINFWQRLFDRWYQFAKSDFSELTQTELSNFRNYAGCLAATSGVFVDIEIPFSTWYTPDIKETINEKIDSFFSQQFVMLGEDDLVTRENAKEIMAAEANPKTYPKVIKSLATIVDDLVSRSDKLTQRDFMIVEHVITLLKAILDNGDDLVVFACSVDITQCADKLAGIVDNTDDKDMASLKLRIRMSSLFSKIEQNNSKLVLRNAFKLRNKFLRYVYNWFDFSVNYSCDCKDADHQKLHDHSQTKDWNFIYIDVAIESIKALALLLDGLVLEAPQVLNERELKFSKSSLFSVYFNTFLKALERFSNVESFPVSVRHKVTVVSDNIVLSLTNLLKSNVDVGLSYALPIGYYSNLAIRVSFLKVFVSIVESYASFQEFQSHDKSGFVAKIFQLVLDNPKLLTALGGSCPSNEAPALAACSLSLACAMNQSAPMVAYLVNEEILSAMKYSDILRRNSFASRCLSSFGRSLGRSYLVSTLQPILSEIRDSGVDFEVEKINPDDPDAEENLIAFMHYLKKLVNVIVSSTQNVPVEFKYVCKRLSEAVDKKFANSRLIAVGSFIFLRFFCPAIVSPEAERIVDVPCRQTQRKFLLLAKVLQNMANGTVASLKWPLLKSREAELNQMNDQISGFLDSLTILDDDVEFEPVPVSDISTSDYNFFHCYVYEHWDLIRSEFMTEIKDKEELAFFKDISHQVDAFFKMAGQPTISYGYELPANITPEAHPDLYDFMTKNSAKDLGPLVETPFVHNYFNQEGLHLLVFSYGEYKKIQHVDEELILYRFVQVCSKVWDQKFVFVVDCTGNDGSMLFPRHLMSMLGNFAPKQMRTNCQRVVYYNVSSGLYPLLINGLKAESTFQTIGSERFSFISSLEDRKTIMNLGLSNHAIRIYNDVRVKFSDVSVYDVEQKRFEPVMLKIGNEYLQMARTTPRRSKFRGELKEINLNDVYKLDQIEHVAATESTSVPNEMTITFKDGRKLILTSAKFLEIMRLLYFTKSRSLNAANHGFTKAESNKSVEDLLGQLFNVVFLGLTSASHEVRSISYNLLAASQKSFKLDIGRDLAQFQDVYFPRDNNSFVVSISERLSQTKPEITGEFIKSFFDVYNESSTSRQRFSAVLYVAPWVNNLYDHVFRSDDEHGKDLIAEIIRNFLAVSTKDSMFLSSFSLSIFSKICLEDRISQILVDEVVLNAVDREAEGKDWKTSISFLTSTPTIEICGYVIKRLREITRIPFPNADGKYTMESHSSWSEITVLTHIAVSLFFDSLHLAEMFLPDVFHIITILVDVGPLDLRTACHQLLLNVLQSFLMKKELSDDAKAVIKSTVDHFTSHRSRLLFGLNRDSSESFSTEISKFSTKISTMESLVASLLEIVEIASVNSQEKSIWIARWNRYCLDAVCRPDSVLKGRALVLLGILSKGGVMDELVCTVLSYIAEMSSASPTDPRYMYLAICTVFALGKITEGLLLESKMFTKMFWCAIVITHSQHSALFQGGLKFITSAIESMNIKEKFIEGDVVGTLMEGRAVFGDIIDRIEGLDEVVITSKNFDQVLLHFAARGLQLPYAKATAISSLKSFFQVRFMNEMMRAGLKGDHVDKSPLCFLFFLFMLTKPSELRVLLDDIDYEDDYIVLDEQVHIPKILVDFMLGDSDAAYLTLYQAALYFNYGNPNEKSSLRFLAFYKVLGQRNPQMFIRLYPFLRTTLRTMVGASTVPLDLLTEVFNVAAIANVMPEYGDLERHAEPIEKLVVDFRLEGLKHYKDAGKEVAQAKQNRGFMIKPFIERMYQ